MHDQVIFQNPIVAIITEIYIRVNVFIGDTLKDFATGGPAKRCAANKIIIVRRKWLVRYDFNIFIRIQKADTVNMRVDYLAVNGSC